VIGNDPETPILVVENPEIISVNSDTSVSLVGEELYINQFEATLDYYVWVPYVFKPADGESAEYGPYSGDVVSFEADTIAPATELTIAVEPGQDLHGYDSPWPGGGGKNKFNSAWLSDIGVTHGTISINQNGDVTLTATANDCYTRYGASSWSEAYRIPVSQGDVVRLTWSVSGAAGQCGIFPNGTSSDFVLVDNTTGVASLTVGAGITFVTIRLGVTSSGNTATYSNVMVTVNNSDTSFAPYENICPISGWDAVSIWNKPTHDTSADPTVTITLGQTVYGGTLDVTGGTITVDRAMLDLGTLAWSYNGTLFMTLAIPGIKPPPDGNTVPNCICEAYKAVAYRRLAATDPSFTIIYVGSSNTGRLWLKDSTFTDLASFKSFISGKHLCYELATPIEIPLTPTQIATLVGQNNVWSDAGAIETVKFSAPGGDCDGFMSSDGYLLCTKQNYDIRLLPYGTKITYYSGENIAGVFYVKNVERVQRAWYKIKATSAIGLLDKQYHRGGIYTGQYFQDVVTEILGSDFNYIIDGVVAVQRVYGWLPYDTKRKNLYQLLLAYGVEITLGDNGAMFFAFPESERAIPIPTDRVFQGGKVIYDEPASLVEINEHSYHYDPSVAEVQLFDNSADESVTDTMVIFDEPIYPASIYCSSGSLTISSVNTNFAVVSGSGILSGKPYVHNIRLISQTNPNAPVEKVVRVEDATLVTFINADNVLARLSEYYFNATRVEQDIKVENEKPGLLYTTQNPFGELITGYIVRMNKSVTSFARATCRFLQNYEPTGAGMAYTDRLVIPLGAGASQVWQIPQAVFEKENPVFRVVLIGKGQDGAPGTDGADGTAYSSSSKGKGGAGGLGGSGGLGGNVLIITLSSQGLTEITLSNSGNDSVLSSAYYNFSSADGAPNAFGYFDILNGQLYAYPGSAGTAGGAGGNGDYYGHNTSELSTATDGENVEYEGVTYYGGKQRPRTIVNGGAVGISSNLNIYCSGAGGGGAAVGNNGGDASPGSRNIDVNGGNGADAIAPHPADNVYGAGGNGGNGGGGGGAGGAREWWNYVYSSVIATDGGTLAPYGGPGKGGKGSDGSAGAYGCAIIYY